jgi:hypothetical protein
VFNQHGKASRRDLLRVGALSAVGLTLSDLFRYARAGTPAAKADACIVVFCWGAPSQQETFDPKPEAPAGIRGEFGTSQTRLPGILFGEHIPGLAQRNHRFTLVRTCAQTSTHHQSAAYEALTGYPPSRDAVALTAAPTDHPNFGSVVSRFVTGGAGLPRFVQLPQLISDVGNLTPGQFAGFLGRQHDPMTICADPSRPDFQIAELSVPADLSPARLQDRAGLLGLIERQAGALEQSAEARAMSVYQQRAVALLTSPIVKKAFDLESEPVALRECYGRNVLGQSCLLARRLVESGVKLVTVMSGFNGKTPQDAWDTHKDNFRKLKNELLPPFDRGVSALLDDMALRGLLERTLLVVMGEFGRTPKINKDAGRDHWQHCYPVLFAGAGARAGLTLGKSDRQGAYPIQGRVCTPADICATIYHCLGIDPGAEVLDQSGKPILLTRGSIIQEMF